MILRIIRRDRGKPTGPFTIFNLEVADDAKVNRRALERAFYDSRTQEVVIDIPRGEFLEVMYHNGVIDPAQEPIRLACAKLGVKVLAVKVGQRYYGEDRDGVFVNKLVQVSFTTEPKLTTLLPRGSRQGMKVYNLAGMNDNQLMALSRERRLALSLRQMKKLAEFQRRSGQPFVTDVFLETFGGKWSDHCNHITWKALGLLDKLKKATAKTKNPNLVSALGGNAGGWKFFGRLVAVFKLETHNSPSEQEPYGGQLTKIGGVIRDILAYCLGALPIGNFEMTVVGEFIQKRLPWLRGKFLSAKTKARETIRAIADYGNPMGIPMLIARMCSHPLFGGKLFALGGTVGLTTEAAAKEGVPRAGDLVVLIGGRTGNDGLHGATVSSTQASEETDKGADQCHVQIGCAYTEQLTMPAVIELRDGGYIRALNDCGAAGLVSAAGELGETAGGLFLNLAAVLLKCAGLENWQIALSESQERLILAVDPRNWRRALAICRKYGLEATVIGVFTATGRFQMVYNPELRPRDYSATVSLSGEICLDVPYSWFDECPLPQIELIEPPQATKQVEFPVINHRNVAGMMLKLVDQFDVCSQAVATTQYDSTVQGRTLRGPLYGRHYNVGTHLAVLLPVYGRQWALTFSQSFSPWQFEADPVQAAINAMVDVVVTQAIAGVTPLDVCLSDNFYTPSLSLAPHAAWYLVRQVEALARLSVAYRAPFVVGKDSSSGSGSHGARVVNVPPSVCVTGMGKIRDGRRLKPHQWQQPDNLIYAVGPQAELLDGSVLSAALRINGNRLDAPSEIMTGDYVATMARLGHSPLVRSAVPINRGGIALRLFEGIEASGWGVETGLCRELFPESFGSALVEIMPDNESRLQAEFSALSPRLVGRITRQTGMIVQGQKLPWRKLVGAWSTRFAKEVYQ